MAIHKLAVLANLDFSKNKISHLSMLDKATNVQY
jgi:hypothetical protein